MTDEALNPNLRIPDMTKISDPSAGSYGYLAVPKTQVMAHSWLTRNN